MQPAFSLEKNKPCQTKFNLCYWRTEKERKGKYKLSYLSLLTEQAGNFSDQLEPKRLTCWPDEYGLKHLGFSGVVIYLVIDDSCGDASIHHIPSKLMAGMDLMPAFLSGIEKWGFLEWSVVAGYGNTL